MQPTTIVLRNTIRNELNKHNIQPSHTYTECKRSGPMPWKHDNVRYITFVFPNSKLDLIKEIVKECNNILPEGKFRVSSSPSYPEFVEDAPKNVYIRATGILA